MSSMEYPACKDGDRVAFYSNSTAMEDEHLTLLQLKEYAGCKLFAVFDGHGGQDVATFCRDNFERILTGLDKFKKKKYAEAMIEAFKEMDRLLKEGIKYE